MGFEERGWGGKEGIRLRVLTKLTEGQAFWRSYDLAPRPPPPPSPISKLDQRHTGRVVGEEPNHTNARKPAWSSTNHSILSGIR